MLQDQEGASEVDISVDPESDMKNMPRSSTCGQTNCAIVPIMILGFRFTNTV